MKASYVTATPQGIFDVRKLKKKHFLNLKVEEENAEDIFVADLFLNKSYKQKALKYGENIELNITLSESAATDYDLTGQVIWPAANVLSEYILVKHEEFVGKTSLELGAGVGVCGLLMSHYCKKTILTDHMDIVLEILNLNVQNNSKHGNEVECRKLAWNVDIEKFEEDFPQGFDIIFGSDIIFWRESLIPLWKTVDKLLSHKPDSQFITSFFHRSKVTEDYLMELSIQFGFEHKQVPIESFSKTDSKSLFLYIFYRKT